MNARSGDVGPRAIALLAALALTAGLLAFAAARSVPKAASATIWHGYRMLLVDSSVEEKAVLGRLSSHGMRGTISESTEPVEISDWVGLETTTLESALDRLLPGDPRRDLYIERLGAWFSARVADRAYRVYYVPTGFTYGSNADLASSLAGLEGRFVLPDSGSSPHPQWRWLAFAFSAMIVSALWGPGFRRVFRSFRGDRGRGRLALRGALAGPWIFLSAFGFDAAVISVLWAAAALDSGEALLLPFLEYRRSSNLRSAVRSFAVRGGPRVSLLIAALGSLAVRPHFIAAVLYTLLAASAAASIAALRPCASARRARSAFVPLPLGKTKSPTDRSAAVVALIAVFVWAGADLLFPFQPAGLGTEARAPMPVASTGPLRPGPVEALASIRAENGESIPGLSDWLAHLAREEAIPLRVLNQTQDQPFAAVALPEPEGVGPSMIFDDAWAGHAYRSTPGRSIESMLLEQGRAVAAEPRSLPDAAARPLAPIDVILYIILFILPLRRIVGVIPAMRDSSTHELRQEA
ncbi:MAG: hypothetical protein ACLQMF_01675 [Rectinemataceae bacterium]